MSSALWIANSPLNSTSDRRIDAGPRTRPIQPSAGAAATTVALAVGGLRRSRGRTNGQTAESTESQNSSRPKLICARAIMGFIAANPASISGLARENSQRKAENNTAGTSHCSSRPLQGRGVAGAGRFRVAAA